MHRVVVEIYHSPNFETKSEVIMKKAICDYGSNICITAADLERANLNEWDRLELHLLDQTAVVIPGRMTAMDLIRVTEALQGFASDLLTALGKACASCDNCDMAEPCDLMTGPIRPTVGIPAYVLEEAGFDSDTKLACEADPEDKVIRVTEADYRYDLTDLPSSLLDTFREGGVCLDDFEGKLMREEVVYGEDI